MTDEENLDLALAELPSMAEILAQMPSDDEIRAGLLALADEPVPVD